MSLQQQCLPLPRRRKRLSNQKSKKKESNNKETTQNPSMDMDMDENFEDNDDDDVHMPTQISDLSEMDATTYLASVSAQASKLPFVFVADENKTGDGSCTTEQQRPQQKKNQDTNEAIWQGSALSVQYLYSNRLKIEPPPSIQHIPPIVRSQKQSLEEYANTIIHDFSNLRLFLHNCLNSPDDQKMIENGDDDDDDDDSLGEVIFQSNTFKKTKNASDERKIPVPPSKDSYNWHIFCLGKEEACGNVGGYYDVSDQEQNDDEEMEQSTEEGTKCDNGNGEQQQQHQQQKTVNDENQSQVKSSTTLFDVRNVPPSGYEPTTSLLCQFDQIIIRRVINHHLHYLTQGCTMTAQRGKWIYSLLARLEKPLHRDEASSLTSLLRELCRIRSELSVEDLKDDDSDDKQILGVDGTMLSTQNELGLGRKASQPKEVLATLNTLIVIIGIYFEQCNSLDAILKVQS